MRTTFVALVGLCAASLVIACDDDKKPTDTAPSATATVSAAAAAPSAAPAPKPSPAELIGKTLKAAGDAWNAHDAAKVAANYEPTGKLVIPGLPEISGKDGLTAEAKVDFAAYSDFKVAISRGFIKGNTATFEWVITGKNDGPWMGKPASGRQMGVAGASVCTFDDDGLIKEEHRYLDLPTLSNQLDAKAKAGTFRASATLPTGATEWHVVKGTPDEAKTLDAGKGLYAAFETKGGDISPFMTDDTVSDDYTTPASVKGLKANKDMVASFWSTFPDLAQTKAFQFAVDGFVVTEGTLTGTQKGALGPIKATNKPVSFHFIDVIQMKDSKTVHLETYGNSAEILVAIGAMPPIAPPAAGSPSAAPAPSAKPK